MSQLTNSARASFSASMGSLGGAATRLVEGGAAADSRGASVVVAVGTSIESAASAAAARGRANGGIVKGGMGVDLPLVGGVQSRLFCCCSGDEGQLLLLLLAAAAAVRRGAFISDARYLVVFCVCNALSTVLEAQSRCSCAY